jgi:hypothetical protein
VEAGRLAIYQKRWADAESHLVHAQSLAPANVEAQRLLESLYEARGEDARWRTAHDRLQELRTEERQMVRLLDQCREAPRDVRPRFELGRWKQQHGDEPDGLRWLFSSLFVDEHFAPTHEALAEYFERTGQPYWAAQHRDHLRAGTRSVSSRP